MHKKFPYKLIDLTHALNSNIPDGKGVTYNYQPIIPGNSYLLDDLVLWFTKKLS